MNQFNEVNIQENMYSDSAFDWKKSPPNLMNKNHVKLNDNIMFVPEKCTSPKTILKQNKMNNGLQTSGGDISVRFDLPPENNIVIPDLDETSKSKSSKHHNMS